MERMPHIEVLPSNTPSIYFASSFKTFPTGYTPAHTRSGANGRRVNHH